MYKVSRAIIAIEADPNKVGLFIYNYLFAVTEKSHSSTT